MAYELFLARLWDAPAQSHGELLDQVRSVALEIVPSGDERWHIGEVNADELEIEMPLGEMTVQREHVSVRLQGISPEVVRLIHAIAKFTNLAIINESGRPRILLVDDGHLGLLPSEIQNQNPPICHSPAILEEFLAPNLELSADEKREMISRRNLLYSQWTHDHAARSIGHGDPQPNVPGLTNSPENRPIYVETKSKEGPLLQGRRFSRFLKARIKSGQALPEGGGIRGSGWQLRLPTGQVFSCKIIVGYHPQDDRESSRQRRIEEWTRIVQEFADGTGRRTAIITGGAFVVVRDSGIHPISECESRRARDEDG